MAETANRRADKKCRLTYVEATVLVNVNKIFSRVMFCFSVSVFN